ncbi:MAG: hypothetical protein LBU83_05740 [Bacteroidales bacterium]|nr:hypothetical protein [Bacteroidales bacterium]
MQELQRIGWENKISEKQKSKLIFPSYRIEEKVNEVKHKRISEQEARFLFVREMEKPENEGFYYSVETPTQFKYTFSKNGKKLEKPIIDKENGESGKTDVCIFDTNFNREHLVEFKALNKELFDLEKDFIKLKYEPKENNEPNYFVHVLKSYDEGTITSLIEKYEKAFEILIDDDSKKANGITKENKVVVFLCFLKVAKKYKDKYIKPIQFNENNYVSELKKLIY